MREPIELKKTSTRGGIPRIYNVFCSTFTRLRLWVSENLMETLTFESQYRSWERHEL